MQTFLLLKVVLGLLVQRSLARMFVEPCGTAVSPRIMNGKNAEKEAAAWMVSVYRGEQLMCGGTIIHIRFVLTSAACTAFGSNAVVSLGTYHRRHPTIEYGVIKGIRHSKYERRTHKNDIGLLHLSRDIPFSRRVHPICIIVDAEMEHASTFDAYGWGETEDDVSSYRLQKFTLDVYDPSKCRRNFGVTLTSKQICAGASVGSPCLGDAGGPVTRKIIVNGVERQTQFGTISYGLPSCSGAGVYTNITSYGDWIVRAISLNWT